MTTKLAFAILAFIAWTDATVTLFRIADQQHEEAAR